MVKCWVYSLKQTNKLRSKRPRFQLRSGIYHYVTIDVDKNLQIPGVGSSEGSRREDGTTVWRLPKPHHSFLPLINILRGFLVALVIKNPPYQCRRHKRWGFDPWVKKIPWRAEWQPTAVFLSGESHGQRSLVSHKSIGSQRVRLDWSDLETIIFILKMNNMFLNINSTK